MTIDLLTLVAAAEEGGGPVSPFEVNFGLFFWTWVVFLALLWLLRKYAWPAILSATEERERKIQEQLNAAEHMHAEAKSLLAEHTKKIQGALAEASAIVARAKATGDQEREQIVAKARQEHDQLVERARREIAGERDRAVQELRREAVDLSLAAASRLLEREVDSERNRHLVDDYLRSLSR